jgi:hypothetical protein
VPGDPCVYALSNAATRHPLRLISAMNSRQVWGRTPAPNPSTEPNGPSDRAAKRLLPPPQLRQPVRLPGFIDNYQSLFSLNLIGSGVQRCFIGAS